MTMVSVTQGGRQASESRSRLLRSLRIAEVTVGCVAALALGVLSVRAVLRLGLRWDTYMYHLPFAAARGGLDVSYVLSDAMEDYFAGFPPLPHLVQGMLWRLSGSVNAVGVINPLALLTFLYFCRRQLKAPFGLAGC